MQDLNDYFSSVSIESRFQCNLGETGGFINFKNSGTRGGSKEFTISLESVLNSLKDIVKNIDEFKNYSRYNESEWRDLGSKYFTDLVLNSMITVQTKPCFTTLSKIISWANDVDVLEYNDNYINLEVSFLSNTITKIQNLSHEFTPIVVEYPPLDIQNIALDFQSLSKPFLLLAGISGTGKTRFVREQAKASGAISENYCLTPVRPDWYEPSDILGYISRLSGAAEYVTTEVLQFIAKAWRAIIDADIKLTVNEDSRLKVTGDRSQLDAVLPYWLCLDEMNLAPVEQYFADYLSVLETREWQWQADEFYYSCDALLSAATIQQLAAETKLKLRADLGFSADNYDEAWQLFCSHGLTIPFNLIVAGTVNMDETTHGFSRKVIDRALSFDFGEFFPNDFEHFFSPAVSNHTLSYPIYAQATIDTLPAMDKDGQRSIQFLQAVNAVLDDTPFKLAFRALNELLLAVISTQPTDDLELQAVWDDFLMCKVLPRIEGDHDKLAVVNHSLSRLVNSPINRSINNATNGNDSSLLQQLSAVLTKQLASIWDEPVGSVKARPDLYRKSSDGSLLAIACRSKAKLAWMQQRLSRSGFTSFWP